MSNITLDAARHIVKYSSRYWIEVRNDAKRKTLFLRPGGVDCDIRRVIVCYDSKVICLVVHDVKAKKDKFFYSADGNMALLKRLIEEPGSYSKLGFREAIDVKDGTTPDEEEEMREKNRSQKEAKKDNVDDKGKGGKKKGKKKVKEVDEDEEEIVANNKSKNKAKEGVNDVDLTEELRILEEKLKKLEAEYKKLKERVDAAEKKKTEAKKKEVAKITPKLRCLLPDNVLKDMRIVDTDTLECLQLTPDGKGVIHSESSGEVFWSSEIPKVAGDCLRASNKKHRPEYLCVGTHGRFFVRFAQGDVEYSGTEEFENLMKLGDVRFVAFGGPVDSYFVQYANGGTVWNNIPLALRQKILARKSDDPRMEFIALGNDKEYFVRFGDDVQYGNLAEKAEKALNECPGTIKEVSFGAGDTLVARYVA